MRSTNQNAYIDKPEMSTASDELTQSSEMPPRLYIPTPVYPIGFFKQPSPAVKTERHYLTPVITMEAPARYYLVPIASIVPPPSQAPSKGSFTQ